MSFRINDQCMSIRMHIAVWAWHHGRFPTLQIDHVNGNGFDNHIENLREVTQSENMRNMVYPWKHRYYFRDRFEAFYYLTLLGRRFKNVEH